MTDYNHRYANDDTQKSFEFEKQNQGTCTQLFNNIKENYLDDFELDVGSENESNPPSPKHETTKDPKLNNNASTISEIFPKINKQLYSTENENDEGRYGGC